MSLLIIASVLFVHSVKAGAIITSFTASEVGDSIQFNWIASSETNMAWYDVVEVVQNADGVAVEKYLVPTHFIVNNPTESVGASYQAGVPITYAKQLAGFSTILLIGLLGVVIGFSKTLRKLTVILIGVFLVNMSCTKSQSTTPPPTLGPGVSSQTQGVFRLKGVDSFGNIAYYPAGLPGYIVVTY